MRPVFTAHPTEAARRSVLNKLRRHRRPAREWPDEPDAAGERRVRGRLEELIDLIWQTDELRVAARTRADEARNAIYYLDELYRDGVRDVLEDLAAELGRLGDRARRAAAAR